MIMEPNAKSNEKSLIQRMESGEIDLKGAAQYFLNHVKKHPTFKTISEEHNKHFGIGVKK